MSAKNRGFHGGGKNDFYETPDYVTKAVLPFVQIPYNGSVCDPCAGKGAILDVVAKAWDVETLGIELVPELANECSERGHSTVAHDALAHEERDYEWPRANLYIMNPPFSLANEFIQKALRCARQPGTHAIVAVLTRISFFFPECRDWVRADMPQIGVGMSPRPSFGLNKHGKPGNDATDYVWAIWYPNERGFEMKLRIVKLDKPKRERKPRTQKTKVFAGLDMGAGEDQSVLVTGRKVGDVYHVDNVVEAKLRP